jgi:hypothetical protein
LRGQEENKLKLYLKDENKGGAIEAAKELVASL